MTIIIMLVVLVGMTWFMQRQQKTSQTRQDQLKGSPKGDEIVTAGGLWNS